MNNLNSVLIEGNLVKDPLLTTTERGSAVCNFIIATNRFYKSGEGMEKEVGFYEIETWSRLAETCHAKGHKGQGVRVVGRLKQSRWTSTDGQSRSKISIVAEHVEFRPNFSKQEDVSEASKKVAV